MCGIREAPPALLGNFFILVGLDPKPFEDALRQDMNQTILLFGIMFLVGAAGFISLVWAQNFRTARRRLEDVEAFTSIIVNQMPVGMMATSRDGRIQKSNDAARAILGQDEEFKGCVEDYFCFMPVVQRLRREETVVEQEIQCRRSETETIPLLVNAAAIRDGEKNTTGHVFLFTDMTNVRQLEEQLRRSERLASLGRLAAGIAHEIRNPLSSIKGFATLLAKRSGGDEKSQRISRVMVEEVERLNRVVGELLDFARPTELHKGLHSCRELIDRTLQLVDKDARHRRVRIESAVDPEDLQVAVDPDRFAQILLNLYLNALQAMDKGGTLRIEAFRQGERTTFVVSDSGTGILPEHLPNIFDPYFTTKPGGVGLGLANVHKLIEAHGGEIEVESSPEQGSSFIIRIPYAL
jgi:two-component system sensor histidine kinase HydH